MKNWLVWGTLVFLLVSGQAWAEKSGEPCAGPTDTVTEPAAVNIDQLLAAMGRLRTARGKPALKLAPEVVVQVKETFDPEIVKTKMEQFYRLLYFIQMDLKEELANPVEFDAKVVREILMASAVWRKPTVPEVITRVTVDRSHRKQPKYEVQFSVEEIRVPLNDGDGFYVYQHGRCQQSKALIFGPEFSFTLRLLRKGNLVAQNFRGVDIFGDFGSRGMIDVDVEYVSLRSVEFYKGTKLGKVRAYISRAEFTKNEHNPLLRLITKFMGDTSVQPIDW